MSKLIEKRASLVAEMRNLLDGSEGLSADDQTKLAQIEASFEATDKAIRADEKLAKIETGLQSIIEESYVPSIEKENNVDSYGDAFYAYARQGLSALTGDRLAALLKVDSSFLSLLKRSLLRCYSRQIHSEGWLTSSKLHLTATSQLSLVLVRLHTLLKKLLTETLTQRLHE